MNKISVESTPMTVGELRTLENKLPICRSSHVGNQPRNELAILATPLSKVVQMMLVDTVKGDDRYSRPDILLRAEGEEVLVSRNQAKSKLVRYVTAGPQYDNRPLSTIHGKAIDALKPGLRPMFSLDFFQQDADSYAATMCAAASLGMLRRGVDSAGKPRPFAPSDIDTLADGTIGKAGALPSLEVMLAMDIFRSLGAGSDTTLHIAGPDMTAYMKEADLAGRVDRLYQESCAQLGRTAGQHTYKVVPGMQLAQLIPAGIVSQHDERLRGLDIDLDAYNGVRLEEV